MNTDLRFYPIESDKVVYIPYNGAIRQAKYLGCYIDNSGHQICGGESSTRCLFKVAGIEETVSWTINGRTKVYWSQRDAQEGMSPIEWKSLSLERFNEIAPTFQMDKIGNLIAYQWRNDEPVLCSFYTYNKWTATISPEMKVEFVEDIRTRKPLRIPRNCYKTPEECRANNRMEVITF